METFFLNGLHVRIPSCWTVVTVEGVSFVRETDFFGRSHWSFR